MDFETNALGTTEGTDTTETLVAFAEKYGLSNEQTERLAGLDAAALAAHIEAFEAAIVDAELAKVVDVEEDVQDTMKVFTVGDLVPGRSLAGRLKGVRHIYSKKLKENWKEFHQPDGQILYYNSIFVFSSLDGKTEWGIFKSPALSLLEKMTTKSSGSGKKDPIVKLNYIGKVEGREELEKEHGIKLTKGTAAHVFKVQHEPNIEILKYEVRGVVNSLNSPLPMTSSAASNVDKTTASAQNYKRLQAARMGSSAALIDAPIVAQ